VCRVEHHAAKRRVAPRAQACFQARAHRLEPRLGLTKARTQMLGGATRATLSHANRGFAIEASVLQALIDVAQQAHRAPLADEDALVAVGAGLVLQLGLDDARRAALAKVDRLATRDAITDEHWRSSMGFGLRRVCARPSGCGLQAHADYEKQRNAHGCERARPNARGGARLGARTLAPTPNLHARTVSQSARLPSSAWVKPRRAATRA
jgi:hypothetical protein